MRLRISHTTRYAYDEPVRYGLMQVRKSPLACAGQTIHDWSIRLEGGKKEARFSDQHANKVDLINLDSGTRELVITCEGEAETEDRSGVAGPHSGHTPIWLFQRETLLTKAGARTIQLAEKAKRAASDPIARLHALSGFIHAAMRYEIGATDAATTAEEALAAGRGVCQDHAHVFISAARRMGIPARYVGGYLLMTDRIEQEAGHAWAEAHVDGLGWIGFDVSNAISPDERYLKVATGLDYSEASPVSGFRHGRPGETLGVAIEVQQQ
jgi:transglutaminase-like putative cysteine protease